MIFLEVTSQTWLITILGFTIVLVLLFVFVFIMKGLGAIMQWIEKKGNKTEQPVVAPVVADNKVGNAQTDNDLAAVTMALHLFYGIHDIDAPKLTLHSHHSTWNEHTFGINNLDR